MKTMTIRKIPDEVARFLATKAAGEGCSINTITVSLLSEAAGFANPAPRRRDLSWLAGTWSAKDERDFSAAVSKCRRIDAKEWK